MQDGWVWLVSGNYLMDTKVLQQLEITLHSLVPTIKPGLQAPSGFITETAG